MYLSLDFVDLRLQLVVVKTIRDGVGEEVEEGYEDRRDIMLVFGYPGRGDEAIREDGRCRRERRYGRVKGPGGSCSYRGAARRGSRRRRWGICLFGWQLKALADVSFARLYVASRGSLTYPPYAPYPEAILHAFSSEGAPVPRCMGAIRIDEGS